jgi:hypothetical protein
MALMLCRLQNIDDDDTASVTAVLRCEYPT